MTIALYILVALASLFVVFWLYSLLADFWTQKLASYEEWADRFYSLSARLLDKEDLPKEWIDTISSLNSWIDDHTMPMALDRVFGKNRAQLARSIPEQSVSDELGTFIDKHPALTREYVSATRAAFLAMTFLAPVNVGANIRAKMAEEWERQRSSKGAGPAVKEIEAVKASHLKLVHSAA